jgi:hypothetical protein
MQQDDEGDISIPHHEEETDIAGPSLELKHNDPDPVSPSEGAGDLSKGMRGEDREFELELGRDQSDGGNVEGE